MCVCVCVCVCVQLLLRNDKQWLSSIGKGGIFLIAWAPWMENTLLCKNPQVAGRSFSTTNIRFL